MDGASPPQRVAPCGGTEGTTSAHLRGVRFWWSRFAPCATCPCVGAPAPLSPSVFLVYFLHSVSVSGRERDIMHGKGFQKGRVAPRPLNGLRFDGRPLSGGVVLEPPSSLQIRRSRILLRVSGCARRGRPRLDPTSFQEVKKSSANRLPSFSLTGS